MEETGVKTMREEESLLDTLAEFDEEDFNWREHGLKMIGDGCYQKESLTTKY